MHRFYYENKINLGETYILPVEESKHALKVLRLNIDYDIEILSSSGIFEGKITSIENNILSFIATKYKGTNAPKTQIDLYQGIPKSDKIFDIIQECTEIGVSKIIAVPMERSVKKIDNKEKFIDKANKICIEACKQSGFGVKPHIELSSGISSCVARFSEYDIILVPWECEKEISIKKSLKEIKQGSKIAVFIGPEGGISDNEIDLLKQHGAIPITFGKRILRTEHAGACTIFSILTLYEDL